LAIGLGTLLGLWQRLAAAGGAALSLMLFLTVSFHASPYYTGADIVFAFAWTPLLLAGAGPLLSADAAIAARARAQGRRDSRRVSASGEHGDRARHGCPGRRRGVVHRRHRRGRIRAGRHRAEPHHDRQGRQRPALRHLTVLVLRIARKVKISASLAAAEVKGARRGAATEPGATWL